MRVRRVLLWTAAAVVGLPVLAGAGVVGWISLHDRSNGGFVSSGEEREYLLHVPQRYDGAAPVPLVISLHAGATWPAHQRNMTRWNRLADQHGFLVVYPAATGFPRVWHTFRAGPGIARDAQFIAELIDTLRARYAIDPRRIYADGMSNGGGMAYVLSCRLQDRIAAFGLVAPAEALPHDWCAEPRPAPVMAFHGDADGIVPYHGGLMGDPFNPVKPTFPPTRERMDRWAARNGCDGGTLETAVSPDAARLDYTGCPDRAPVTLFTLYGAGHAWPGGRPPPEWRVGPTNTTVDATAELWGFFQQHPLP